MLLYARAAGFFNCGRSRFASLKARKPPVGTPAPQADTPFSGMWQQVDRAVSGVIDKTTASPISLASGANGSSAYVHTWEI